MFGDDWLNADQLRRHFRKCLRHIGRTDGTYTFHGLRHTAGTLMIQAGVNIKDVADHLGHSSTRVTERYLHAADKNKSRTCQLYRIHGCVVFRVYRSRFHHFLQRFLDMLSRVVTINSVRSLGSVAELVDAPDLKSSRDICK